METALATRAELIGINNRNLSTLTIDRSTTRLLSESIRSAGRAIVSESGMRSADDIREMKPFCDAFLIGSSIMEQVQAGKETRGIRMRIKCCGITRPEDARCAEACGADAIGVVVFSPSSLRTITLDRAREIFDAVGPFTTRVAVSHTTSNDDLAQILALHPDAIQISHPFVLPEQIGRKGDPGNRAR